MSIYFVSGAGGSGKSSIIPYIQELLGDNFQVIEFDSKGVPEGADTKWRQETTEKWIATLLKQNKNKILCGQMVLGEILASPSAEKLKQINYFFLDVSDKERIKRLIKRDGDSYDKHMLPWADWLRNHHKDPQYKQHVIKDNSSELLIFSKWDYFKSWDNSVNITFIDTTGRSIQGIAMFIYNSI